MGANARKRKEEKVTEEQQKLLGSAGAVPAIAGQAPPLPNNAVGVIQVVLVKLEGDQVGIDIQASIRDPAQLAWYLEIARDMVKAGAMGTPKQRSNVVLATGQVPRA